MPYQLFSYRSLSLSGHLLIYLLGYQSKVYVCTCYLAFPKTRTLFSLALVYVAVPTVGYLSYSLTICVVIGAG